MNKDESYIEFRCIRPDGGPVLWRYQVREGMDVTFTRDDYPVVGSYRIERRVLPDGEWELILERL